MYLTLKGGNTVEDAAKAPKGAGVHNKVQSSITSSKNHAVRAQASAAEQPGDGSREGVQIRDSEVGNE